MHGANLQKQTLKSPSTGMTELPPPRARPEPTSILSKSAGLPGFSASAPPSPFHSETEANLLLAHECAITREPRTTSVCEKWLKMVGVKSAQRKRRHNFPPRLLLESSGCGEASQAFGKAGAQENDRVTIASDTAVANVSTCVLNYGSGDDAEISSNIISRANRLTTAAVHMICIRMASN